MRPGLAGVSAAVLAEVVFTALVFGMRVLRGLDPWAAVKVPASFLIGPEAVRPVGFVPGDVALGVLAHLFFAGVVGSIYAAIVPRTALSPLAGGLLAGAILYGFGFWILPALFPDWLGPFSLPAEGRAGQALTHLVYGLALGFAYKRLRGSRFRGPEREHSKEA